VWGAQCCLCQHGFPIQTVEGISHINLQDDPVQVVRRVWAGKALLRQALFVHGRHRFLHQHGEVLCGFRCTDTELIREELVSRQLGFLQVAGHFARQAAEDLARCDGPDGYRSCCARVEIPQ
jgi:hypothetical protein